MVASLREVFNYETQYNNMISITGGGGSGIGYELTKQLTALVNNFYHGPRSI